jgi:hypothetical protein
VLCCAVLCCAVLCCASFPCNTYHIPQGPATLCSLLVLYPCAAASLCAQDAHTYCLHSSFILQCLKGLFCCCCLLHRVFLYEKTLPGLGGRSLIDGGLADSGATLAHEIGHQLVGAKPWQYYCYYRACSAGCCKVHYEFVCNQDAGMRQVCEACVARVCVALA